MHTRISNLAYDLYFILHSWCFDINAPFSPCMPTSFYTIPELTTESNAQFRSKHFQDTDYADRMVRRSLKPHTLSKRFYSRPMSDPRIIPTRYI